MDSKTRHSRMPACLSERCYARLCGVIRLIFRGHSTAVVEYEKNPATSLQVSFRLRDLHGGRGRAARVIRGPRYRRPLQPGGAMKADDPRLEKARKEAIERVNKLHDLIVTVLKYHVHAESLMVEFIEAHGETTQETFAEKIKQCEDLNPPEIDAATWTLLRKANRLRNAIAHKIDGPEVTARLQQTRDAYAALSDQAAKDTQVYTEVQLALMSFTHCSSFISVATENKKEAEKKKP
jgi:hypothetical protein